ncbi:exported hypothetical protein [Verrucomicrobia bacterium]|nr:exported hypothetical protein [Verrucomicrobiota bacterium]
MCRETLGKASSKKKKMKLKTQVAEILTSLAALMAVGITVQAQTPRRGQSPLLHHHGQTLV